MKDPVPVVDLFAGPGGLNEGFSSLRIGSTAPFRTVLSIEKDPVAHATLKFRAFFREFRGAVPDAYYRMLSDGLSLDDLYYLYPEEAAAADRETWCAELGVNDQDAVDRRVRQAVPAARSRQWVLIGGPPCQAYSLVGRARMRSADPTAFERDPRHFLYREYLRILAKHQPPVFVFENVKGLLSSTVAGERIFDRIRLDLEQPGRALGVRYAERLRYTLHTISEPRRRDRPSTRLLFGASPDSPEEYIVQAENHGIPQARHRVIIVGVKQENGAREPRRLRGGERVSASTVLDDLPALRSRLSKEEDSPAIWAQAVRDALRRFGFKASVTRRGASTISIRDLEHLDAGNEFVPGMANPGAYADWFRDKRLPGFWHHSSRSHIRGDVQRYVFAASFANRERRSPILADFPEWLRPKHRNVDAGVTGHMFSDRFRVQLRDQPSTTVTSHIAKDGHYYIHYDPLQARSLTVREAARLQTFPDNYFFCGPRTLQYQQIGNAVPPLLARQIAEIVYELLV